MNNNTGKARDRDSKYVRVLNRSSDFLLMSIIENNRDKLDQLYKEIRQKALLSLENNNEA